MNIWKLYQRHQVRQQAAEWHTRIGNGLTDAEREKFEAWIAHPGNAREFRANRTIVDWTMELKGPPCAQVLSYVAETKPTPSRAEPLLKWLVSCLASGSVWASTAATAAVFLAVSLGWSVLRNEGYVAQTYRTATGEFRDVVLPDGSIVALNTQTEIEWVGSPRDRCVRLIRGEAYFQVIHDPSRPFRILLSHSQVQVLGTSFDVYQLSDGDVRVSVISGMVAVEALDDGLGAPSWSRRLTAGQQIEYSPVGLVADVHSVEAPKVIRWRQGMLETQGEELKDFVSDLSRYTTERIVITDPRAATQRVGGAFSIRDVDDTLNRLSRIAQGTVTYNQDEAILGYRPAPAAPRPRTP